jgi:hypothetical protein
MVMCYSVPDFHDTLAAIWNHQVAPASQSIPQGLVLFAAATEPNSYFKWRPHRTQENQTSGFYLLETTGPELHYIYGLGNEPMEQAPGYLMHAVSKKIFAFRPGIFRHTGCTPASRAREPDIAVGENRNGILEDAKDQRRPQLGISQAYCL